MSELRPKYLEAVRDGLNVSGVTGNVKAGGGAWLGDADQQPEAAGCLHLDGSIQKSDHIGCHAYRTNMLAIPPTTWTPGSYEAVRFDQFGMWAVATPTIITIRRPGIYLIIGHGRMSFGGAVYTYQSRLMVNGVIIFTAMSADNSAALLIRRSTAVCTWFLDEGDQVSYEVYHNYTADVNWLGQLMVSRLA